ncbi:MAG: hypothetical protein BRD38_03910 [Bacteroidetes bacterium QH_9_67_14]|nr:MAG: hypothetical protein BRD38_03910 [Bacteroidetes bacterium QH_9_67_14]
MQRLPPTAYFVFLLLLSISTLSACSLSASGEDGQEEPSLAKTGWQLVSLNADSADVGTAGQEYRLFFKAEGEFDGVSDCNDVWGRYGSSQDGSFQIEDMSSTLAQCQPESINEEFVRLLNTVTACSVSDDGGRLTLSSDEGDLVFESVSREEFSK